MIDQKFKSYMLETESKWNIVCGIITHNQRRVDLGRDQAKALLLKYKSYKEYLILYRGMTEEEASYFIDMENKAIREWGAKNAALG